MLKNILQTESEGAYDVRMLILGHIQQGDVPTPMDRIRATLMGAKAIGVLIKNIETRGFWKGGYGVVNSVYKETPLQDLMNMMDFQKRTVKAPWWAAKMAAVGPQLQVNI